MKKIIFIPVFMLITIWSGGPSHAGEFSTHNAYRITSYNLGAILDDNESFSFRNSMNFQPLLITSTTADILNNEMEGTVPLSEVIAHTANTRGVALSATFDASKKISLHGAFGLTRNLWSPDSADYENESSWEANLGIMYKFLDNISYEMHFGYMDTGDLFAERSSYSDVESIIMISNQLTLSF